MKTLILPSAPTRVYDPIAHYADTLVTLLQQRLAVGDLDTHLMDKIERLLWPRLRESPAPEPTVADVNAGDAG